MPQKRTNSELLQICNHHPEKIQGITKGEIEQLHKHQPGICLEKLQDRLTPRQFDKCVEHYCSAIRYANDAMHPEQRAKAFKGAPCIAMRLYPEEFTTQELEEALNREDTHYLLLSTPIPSKLGKHLAGIMPKLNENLRTLLCSKIAAGI